MGSRRSGRKLVTSGGGSFRCAKTTWSSLPRSKGGAPVRHSNSTHASEYTSARASTAPPSICSGATYEIVPTKAPVRLAAVEACLARPKSQR